MDRSVSTSKCLTHMQLVAKLRRSAALVGQLEANPSALTFSKASASASS